MVVHGLAYLFAGVTGGLAATMLVYALLGAAHIRSQFEWIVWGLPLVGLIMGWVIDRFRLDAYTMNQLIEEVEGEDTTVLPPKMGLWAFLGTVTAHLFGASVGREGAAIQSSAVLAGAWADMLTKSKLYKRTAGTCNGPIGGDGNADADADEAATSDARLFRQEMLIAGIAAGFAGAFRAPFGAAFFAIEMIRPGRLRWRSLGPALIGGLAGNSVAALLRTPKEPLATLPPITLSALMVGRWIVFGLAVAVMVVGFIELVKLVHSVSSKYITPRPWRMAFGGLLLVALWQLVDTSIYLGLGSATISAALHGTDIPTWAFLIKLIFTGIAIGVGFPGGEVTPLFFMGSTLGSTLAGPLGLPVALATRVGLGATFAAASNSPLAVTVMAIDLFGYQVAPWVGLCSVIAYFAIGNRSIYHAQIPKLNKFGSST